MATIDANDILERSKRNLAEASKFSELLFEKSQAYNNAIILAGFGGLFALLGATATILPKDVLAAVAILLGISLAIYVGYIIFNTYAMSIATLKSARSQLKNARELQQSAGLDLTEISRALKTLEANIQIWKAVWVASVTTGLGAGIIMLIFYIGALLQQ